MPGSRRRLAMALQHLPDEPLITSLQGILYARRNQTGRALECVRRALDLPRSFGRTHHTYYQFASVYAVLGETDKAMAWLERSVDTGFACWPFFKIDPHLEPLREKAEFKRPVADLEYKYTALKIQKYRDEWHALVTVVQRAHRRAVARRPLLRTGSNGMASSRTTVAAVCRPLPSKLSARPIELATLDPLDRPAVGGQATPRLPARIIRIEVDPNGSRGPIVWGAAAICNK
jgi:hypothetical protein